MKLTETKLKQLIKEELEMLVNEGTRSIPGGEKAMEQVKKKIQSYLGDDYVLDTTHYPGGNLSQTPDGGLYDMFWTITVQFGGIRDPKSNSSFDFPSSRTTRSTAYVVYITRVRNEDTGKQELIIGEELTNNNKMFPAAVSTLSKNDPDGFWHHLKQVLEQLTDVETKALTEPTPKDIPDIDQGR
tara:strand:- start:9 stop:563 length:555 start_codon:yes stop_codon:yes gene_type:complete